MTDARQSARTTRQNLCAEALVGGLWLSAKAVVFPNASRDAGAIATPVVPPVGADIKFTLDCRGIEAPLGIFGGGAELIEQFEENQKDPKVLTLTRTNPPAFGEGHADGGVPCRRAGAAD
jgi:hypothetical protein